MQTQCTQQTFEFEALDRREVVARFDGGPITPDAGGLFLGEVEERTRIVGRLARCFTDRGSPILRAAIFLNCCEPYLGLRRHIESDDNRTKRLIEAAQREETGTMISLRKCGDTVLVIDEDEATR